MSPDYVRPIRGFFTKQKVESTTEQAFLSAVGADSPHWAGWAGNKANFRKPGTPISKNK